MNNSKNTKDDQKRMLKVISIILLISASTFFVLKWISPESKNIGKFLFGFGATFVGIVFCAYFIRYIKDLYKQIKSKK
jgi:hypothetical protein